MCATSPAAREITAKPRITAVGTPISPSSAATGGTVRHRATSSPAPSVARSCPETSTPYNGQERFFEIPTQYVLAQSTHTVTVLYRVSDNANALDSDALALDVKARSERLPQPELDGATADGFSLGKAPANVPIRLADFQSYNAIYGTTHNPWQHGATPGGSSGGCGAAVAAGLTPLALGSDTNGSIRVPSSFCGVWGLKPTFGRLSRRGSYPFVNSIDHLGPFADDLDGLALAYDALQGPDPLDPGCFATRVQPGAALALLVFFAQGVEVPD